MHAFVDSVFACQYGDERRRSVVESVDSVVRLVVHGGSPVLVQHDHVARSVQRKSSGNFAERSDQDHMFIIVLESVDGFTNVGIRLVSSTDYWVVLFQSFGEFVHRRLERRQYDYFLFRIHEFLHQFATPFDLSGNDVVCCQNPWIHSGLSQSSGQSEEIACSEFNLINFWFDAFFHCVVELLVLWQHV